MIYMSTWLLLVSFFVVFMESLVGGIFLEEVPCWECYLSIYNLTPLSVLSIFLLESINQIPSHSVMDSTIIDYILK